MITARLEKAAADAALAAKLRRLRDQRPFFKAWSAAVASRARNNANMQGGRRFWHDQVANTVEVKLYTARAQVFTRDKVAVHKETGGPIRAKTARFLTIPLEKRSGALSPKAAKKTKQLHRRGRALGYTQGRGRNARFIPVFALVRQTRPQRKFPWWPTCGDARAIGLGLIDRYL